MGRLYALDQPHLFFHVHPLYDHFSHQAASVVRKSIMDRAALAEAP